MITEPRENVLIGVRNGNYTQETTSMHKSRMRIDVPFIARIRRWPLGGKALMAFVLGAGSLLSSTAQAADQQTFKRPIAAIEAFVSAVSRQDLEGLLNMFGRSHEKELLGGDPIAARANLKQLSKAIQEMHRIRDDGPARKVLIIGSEAWPMPFPVVRKGGTWRFDTAAGLDEVVNRRIGRNELDAIAACQAYFDAQIEYASADRDGDEALEYAQRIRSNEGKRDGLFWVSGPNEDPSPFGPLVAEAQDYLDGRDPGDPFKGYYYKILTRQGAHMPGGRYDYVINGNMIGGFALVAFPADYGNSGVMTFVCSHHGKIFQKNLGPDTVLIAAGMEVFSPDGSWSEVTE